jgi:hypothetical protein
VGGKNLENKLFVFTLIVILTLAGFCGCINLNTESPSSEVREYFESEYDANDDTILSVSTVNGAITITSWDGVNISLNATKRSTYGIEDLDKAEIIVTENDNEITIEIQHTQPIRTRAVDLDINIPYNVTVKSAYSTNGPIQITDTKGDIVLSNTNGPINIEDVDGYIKASTTNGGIEIKGTTGIDDLTTTNGGITAEIFDIKDDVNIQSTNGGITLYIKSSINASIEIATINGGISVDDALISITESSSKSLKGTIGTGGDTIKIQTTNGDINVYEL